MSADLTAHYLGLPLRGPLVVSACPLTAQPDSLARLADEGAAAAVLPSLFEEQVVPEGTPFAQAVPHDIDPDRYLEMIENAKAAVDIPILASLNGHGAGDWVRYAKMAELAGADAIELNVHHVPTSRDVSGADVEQRCCELVAAVRGHVSIPLAVKIGPTFAAPLHFSRRLVEAGASAVVLFDRVLSPDLDLDRLEVVPAPSLSDGREVKLRIQWVALLAGRVEADLAASGGVHHPLDAVKLLLAGADVVMLASTLVRNGPGHLRTMLEGIKSWMEERKYLSVEQMKGSLSWSHYAEPTAYERDNYVRSLITFAGDEPV